ncbi:hypothetical protein HKX48_000945 [Thoreauomyces humboldtii]|nr:hypothetical protein HKX48_000945 [Thoreauomyces humboldtii]
MASPSTFSPYQPPPDQHRPTSSYQAGQSPSPYNSPTRAAAASSSSVSGAQADAERVNKYETSLGARVDIEAALCYALSPVSGIIFLILETKNDYVRFHAWQSIITFTALLVLMFFFSLFSATGMLWFLFIVGLGAQGWLGYKAYTSGDSLDRFQLPYVGQIASQWVDSE